MPGSGAGLIRAHRRLTLPASSDTYTMGVYYASGVAPTSATSLVYPKDRYVLADAAGFTKFQFNVSTTGTVSGTISVAFYYTNSMETAAGLHSFDGLGAWNLMAAPSDQSGTGSSSGSPANPITVPGGGLTGQYMQFSGPLLAYRVTTNGFTGGGSVIVDVLSTP